MAFDSEDYLADWRDRGKWPDIHDEITELVAQTYQGRSVLDFCASTGILGQRLQDQLRLKVCATEWLAESIERGRSFGINVPTQHLRLLPGDGTLEHFVAWLREHEVTGIVARRCLSDVFGGPGGNPWPAIDYGWAREWCAAVVEAGVRELWHQGRAFSKRSVHPIPNTAAELSCLATHFTVAETTKNCAYVVARPAAVEVTDAQRQAIFNGTLQP